MDHAIPAALAGFLQVFFRPREQRRVRLTVSRKGDCPRTDGHRLGQGSRLESKLQPPHGGPHALRDSHRLQVIRVQQEYAHAFGERPHEVGHAQQLGHLP